MRNYVGKQGSHRRSVVLAGSLLIVVAMVYSVSAALWGARQDAYYTQLSEKAAASGVNFAEACLRINNGRVTWSDDKPLKPETDCYGEAIDGYSVYAQQFPSSRSYFVVGAVDSTADAASIVNASQGYVETLSADKGTWQVFGAQTVYAQAVPVDGSPVGSSIEGAWTAAPQGYLLENGQAVSRTTYADLFAVIGTTFGAGNGSTTFNVPDSTGRVQVAKSTDTLFDVLGEKGGELTHTLTIAEMPSHQHNQPTGPVDDKNFSAYSGDLTQNPPGDGSATAKWLGRYTAYEGGGGAYSVVQPYITSNRAIKY